jgi:peroxiredoxin
LKYLNRKTAFSVGTRNIPGFQGAIQSKVNNVKASLDGLKASINALPNIDTDIETQTRKISALQVGFFN